jgi:hypothetical protein
MPSQNDNGGRRGPWGGGDNLLQRLLASAKISSDKRTYRK